MSPVRSLAACVLGFWLSALAVAAEPPKLRVAVLGDTPLLSYVDAEGNLTGFCPALARALCSEMGAACEFRTAKLDYLVDDLAADHFDIVATGLLQTPERSKKVLFTDPVYRSITYWFARPGVKQGQAGVRVSAFKGSAQERLARARRWDTIVALNYTQMVEQLSAGVAQAALVPLMTSLHLRDNPQFMALDLESSVLKVPELDVHARFAINPRRAELQDNLNQALDRIKRNGTYDRINSEFLPLRVE